MKALVYGVIVVGVTVAGPVVAETYQSTHHSFRTATLLEGLEHPWSIAFLPDGGWLITERPGRLRFVRDGQLLDHPVSGVPPVHAEGQGGLLDVVLHPRFSDNGLVYLSYSKRCTESGNTTAVGRGVWRDGALHGFEELYEADACAPRGRHHGSRIVFDNDGYMFVTVGDRGVQDRAQELSDNIGVVLRLNDDGSIPKDNPFVGNPEVHDANWSVGHRNAQGIAVHPETGDIWSHEHGPRGGDELNLVRRGRNYGWPVATFGIEYNGRTISEITHQQAGMEPPVKQWTPSIAPSGLAIYVGDAFPTWRNDFFVGALAHQQVVRIRFDGHVEIEEEKLLDRTHGRIRDVRVGPDGLIYVLTDDRNGRLIRLEPIDR